MNNIGHTPQSVLLPEASVTLFSNDRQSHEVFTSISDDWRFARVVTDARAGSVEDAIAFYNEYESPDLIIIQTETIEGDLSARLEELSLHCGEHTSAIIVGPVNDVDLYRDLMAMGVSDYLVQPLQLQSFSDNIAATLLDKMGETDSRLIALIGAKGGVGTTSVSEAMAWGISEELGQKTLLMDAACGWSTLSVGMNFEPSTTLTEAVRAAVDGNDDSLTRMLFQAGSSLSVLTSGGDIMLEDAPNENDFETLIDHFLVSYPVVIADLSSASSNLQRAVLRRAHEVFVVTSPALASVRASRTLVQEIKDIRGGMADNIDVIVNMCGLAAKQEVSKAQIEDGLGFDVAQTIPFDPALFVGSESEGRALLDQKEGKPIVYKLMPLVQDIVSSKWVPPTEDEGGRFSGLIKKISELRHS